MSRQRWFDRQFELGLPPESLPEILNRFRGTPYRLADRTQHLTVDALTRRIGDRWSIQENVGHLLDLESLWSGRLDDLEAGRDELRPADLENRMTHEAEHNQRYVTDLLVGFGTARRDMVRRIESWSDEQVRRTALHPRLQQPMTVVDLLFFVAEHDDHHLREICELSTTIT
jgi:uncharacterized damage-inducible protein DinB